MGSRLTKKKGTLILSLRSQNELSSDYDRAEAHLLTIDGIYDARVNNLTQVIKIEFDPEKLSIEEIRDELRKIQ